MATLAQIRANKRNALKSTGPRGPEGKQRSSRNALKWGLFSRDVLLSEEDMDPWNKLSGEVRALLHPADPVEEMLMDEVIANWFRLARCLKIDSGLFRAYSNYQGRSCGLGTAFAQAAQLDCFGKLSRYEQHLEKKLALSLQRFHSAQRSRQVIKPGEASPALAAPTQEGYPTNRLGKLRNWRLILSRVTKVSGIFSRSRGKATEAPTLNVSGNDATRTEAPGSALLIVGR